MTEGVDFWNFFQLQQFRRRFLGFGGSLPQALAYRALASDWVAPALPMGTATLAQPDALHQPELGLDGWLTFTEDSLATTEAPLLEVMNAGSWECSVMFRPTALTAGTIWAAGWSGSNSDNAIYLYLLSTGELRLYIDGTVGAGAQSFSTTTAGLQVGVPALITVTLKAGLLSMRVFTSGGAAGAVLEDRAVTGAQPSGMDQFAVGARFGATVQQYCAGAIQMIEVREI